MHGADGQFAGIPGSFFMDPFLAALNKHIWKKEMLASSSMEWWAFIRAISRASLSHLDLLYFALLACQLLSRIENDSASFFSRWKLEGACLCSTPQDVWLWGSYFGRHQGSFCDLQPWCLKIWNLKPVSFSGFKSKFHGLFFFFFLICMTWPHYLTSEPGYLEYKINVRKEFSTWGNSVSYDKVGGPGRHCGDEARQGQIEKDCVFTHGESWKIPENWK